MKVELKDYSGRQEDRDGRTTEHLVNIRALRFAEELTTLEDLDIKVGAAKFDASRVDSVPDESGVDIPDDTTCNGTPRDPVKRGA